MTCATCTRNIIGKWRGTLFYHLHLLFDKHHEEQDEWSMPGPSRSVSTSWAASPSRWGRRFAKQNDDSFPGHNGDSSHSIPFHTSAGRL